MAAAKQFELLFQLTARLGPNFSQSFKNASQAMKAMQSDLRNADKKLKDVSAYQKQQTAVEKSRQRVNELQAEHENLVREIEEVGEATPELTRKLQANEKALAKAEDATAREEERLSELSETLRQAGVNTDNLGQDTAELQRQYERLEQAQKKVQDITEKQAANKAAIQQTKGQLMGLAGTVTALGAAIYAGPVTKAAEFQEQMSTVKAIAGNVSKAELPKVIQKANEMGLTFKTGANETETAMNILAAKAKQMGATTKFTAAEAGEAMEYMAMAGWKTNDMLGGIEGIMNLAAASGEELGSVSDIVTDALTAFGLSASDAGHFSDVLAQASSNANTNVSMMGSTFQKVAPVAGALGYSVEDMSLGIGLMANASIKAEVAGTSLKTALANMAKPTKQQAAYMDKYHISLTKSDGTMKSFGEVVDNLRGSLGGLSEQEQIAAATAIFGKESFAGMLAIVNASEKDYKKLTEAVYNCDGAAKQMADTKLDNLNGSITLAKSAFDALQVELGELLLPTLTEGVKKFTDIVNIITDFVRKNPEATKTIAKVAAGLIGLKAGGLVAKLGFLEVKGGILSVQKAFTMIKGLGITKYLSSMSGGFGGILTKILPLVGVIAAVGGAIYYVSTHLEQVRRFIQKTFGDEGLAVFDKLWAVITQVGRALKDAFFMSGTGVLDTLKEIIPTIVSTLQTGLLPLLPMIADLVTQILPLVGQLVTAILPVLGTLISTVITVLASLVAEVLPVIISLISAILPLVTQIIQSVLPVFIELVNTIVPILIQIIEAILPVIIQLIQTLLPIITQIIEAVLPVVINLLNTLLPIFTTIIEAILPPLSALLQALIPVIQLVAEVLASVLGSALQSISTIVQNVMQMFQGLIDFITGVFTGNWTQAWNGIRNIFSGAVGGLGEIIKGPLRAVVSAVNTVIRGLNKVSVPDWVPGIGGKGINIPEIPGFARGTERTPETFIAGEDGPELITGAAGRKVFTAAQTGQILQNIAPVVTANRNALTEARAGQQFNRMAQAQELNTASNVNAGASGAGTITIHVTNSHNVTVTDGNAENVRAQLEQYDESFLEKIREIIVSILREQKEQEGRVAYA